MSQPKDELIKYRFDRAKETFDEAQIMADADHWNACVNRLYYTCFYAVNALLLKHGLSSAKHAGVRSLFNQHFINTQIVPKEMGRLYNILFEYRQQSDYEDLFKIEKQTVIPWIKQVQTFIVTLNHLTASHKLP